MAIKAFCEKLMAITDGPSLMDHHRHVCRIISLERVPSMATIVLKNYNLLVYFDIFSTIYFHFSLYYWSMIPFELI